MQATTRCRGQGDGDGATSCTMAVTREEDDGEDATLLLRMDDTVAVRILDGQKRAYTVADDETVS